ncbi:lytic murein transglycosylase [Frigidibacter oleivorans]|uniref:lytic murein transglycosylase n=1 Tax=Frigidibacter oleivorans TaxID=2487129 RepID=UPI000F8D30CA|nr:lytic murein transglycosylase [Frigidibacter oleivorans]
MRLSPVVLCTAFTLLPACGGAEFAAPLTSPVPVTRSSVAGFDGWVRDFRARALASGVSAATYDRSMQGVRYQPSIIALDRNQSEFTRAIWDYLDGAVSGARIADGRAAMARQASQLAAIERRYGVDAEVVAAVWGLESSFGANRGSTATLPALATLAYDGRRGAFFEEQLIAALKIVQAGDVSPQGMVGSWAGAMGHTQFMPTSFLDHAVDFTGDGRRDIWSDDPTDALASTAAYLAQSGWRRGEPWGLEVRLPEGFDRRLVGKETTRSVGQWAAMGVAPAAGGSLPTMGAASVLTPAGARGPAFLIGPNFAAITRYNTSDSYAIGIGHLADRLAGKGGFVQSWPRGDRALSTAERMEMQRLLTAKGFDTGGVDGKLGSGSLAALRAWQASVGLPPDGYASAEMLERLRAS